MSPVNRGLDEIKRAWSDSRVLTGTSLSMLVALSVIVAVGLSDNTVISGAPAWVKPAKFSISAAIFLGTVAWLYRFISVWPGFMRAMAWVFSGVLIIEVGIVSVQAARGTSSHFNVATPVNGLLFGIMGGAILILWLGLLGVGVALLRQKFFDPAWGWWLRLAVLVTLLGSAAGGIMVRPTQEQAAALRSGEVVTTVGAHTVGGPDGGSGLPGVGWSTDYGDLRVPHFFGLHGFQILPILGWLAMRRGRNRTDRQHTRLAITVTASYLGFFALLTLQALGGQSAFAPDIATLLVLAVWLIATIWAVGLSKPGAGLPRESQRSGAAT